MSNEIQTRPKKEKAKGSMLFACGNIASVGSYYMMGYITYALTESAGMSALMVGTILLISRIFDGISDIVAGFIIDKSHFRLGKARPFELFYIPLWITVILCFSVPGNLSNIGKIIWVFLTYNLSQTVCYTFTNGIQSIRLKRTFAESMRVRVTMISTIVLTLGSVVISISLPILISIFENQPHGWTIISTIYAVPCMLLGMLEFFFLKEMDTDEDNANQTAKEKVSIMDTVKALVRNKYIVFVMLAYLVIAIYNSLGSMSTYFFKYIYGDVAVATIPNLIGCLAMVLLILLPKAIEKLGTQKLCLLCFMAAAVSSVIKNFMPLNLVWITVWGMVVAVAINFISSVKNIILIECMDYGIYKTGVTVEGLYSAVGGMVDKIGMGIGSLAIGIIMEIGGYDETLAVQSESTLASIRFGWAIFPAIIFFIGFVAMLGYGLSGKIGEIRNEMKQKGVSVNG